MSTALNLQFLGVVDEGHDRIHQVQGAGDDTERAQGESHLPLRGDQLVVVIGHVSVPVVQGSATNSDPHKRTDDVHDGVTQLPKMAKTKVIRGVIEWARK